MQKKKALTKKEQLFCSYYAACGNPRRAAAKAGWKIGAERTGLLLLRRSDIRGEILRTVKESAELAAVQSGWARLALGEIGDAVRLLYHNGEEPPPELDEMELLNVAEIKRPRGGGLEIKFFDRIKALEKLQELSAAGEVDESASFYAALENGAAALREDGGANEE